MKTKSLLLILLLLGTVRLTTAAEIDVVRDGYSLTQEAADQLEGSLRRNSNDENARLRLLGFYAGLPRSMSIEDVRARRADHVGWLIQRKPTSNLFSYATAVWKISVKGDDLADPSGFERGKSLWLAHVKGNPRDQDIRMHAASFIQLGDPETAATLLKEANITGALGSLYAEILLGIVAYDYKTGEPSVVDDALRLSDFALQVLNELRASNNGAFIGQAGYWMAVQGGMLYADGKTSWDYTPLARELLTKGRTLAPDNLLWHAVSTDLPTRGDRPPRVLRVGGNVAQSTLRKQIAPTYPELAKTRRIQGTVLIDLVIGLDGKVVKAVVESGPAELAPSALEAVSQWEYAPTLLGGKPAFVVTKVSVSYRL